MLGLQSAVHFVDLQLFTPAGMEARPEGVPPEPEPEDDDE